MDDMMFNVEHIAHTGIKLRQYTMNVCLLTLRPLRASHEQVQLLRTGGLSPRQLYDGWYVSFAGYSLTNPIDGC